MVKMALSAMIRHVMPMTPLDGTHLASDWREFVVVAAFMRCSFGSFVFPIGVGWVLDVPKRTATLDRGGFGEVVFRRWRTRGPLQGPGIPRIVPGQSPLAQRQEDVQYEDQCTDHLEHHADRANEIPDSPTASGFVRVNTPRHSQDTGNVHRVECDMETDEEQPKMPFTHPLAHQAARGFRVPIVNGCENHEYQCAHQHEMKVCNYEVGVVELPVEWGRRQHNARKSREQKLKEEADAEQHRRVEAQFASPHCSEPVEDFDAGRNANQHG